MVIPRGYWFALISLVILLPVISSCKQETVSLELSEYELCASYKEQSLRFTIQTQGRWELSVPVGWIVAASFSGEGTASVELKLEENATIDSRSALLTVTSGRKYVQLEVSQEGAGLLLDTYNVRFDRDGQPHQVHVITELAWEVVNPDGIWWCEIEPVKGVGSAVINLSPIPITERKKRGPEDIIIRFGSSRNVCLTVSQDQENLPPSQPHLNTPSNHEQDVELRTEFRWEASTDPDGDEVHYSLLMSTDMERWNTLNAQISNTSYRNILPLKSNTIYYWKVQARDDFGGITESAVHQFTTEGDKYYGHGEFFLIADNSASAPEAVHLVITGDGFTEEDYVYGGAFETAVGRALEAFMSLEPYPTYRNYFRVTAIAAHSAEKGVSIRDRFMWGDFSGPCSKDTYFNTLMHGGTSTLIECDFQKVFDFAKLIPEITDETFKSTTVIVLLNQDIYAGCCARYTSGESISMIPLCADYFEDLVRHEAAGHGFGALADEYDNKHQGAITQEYIEWLENERAGDIWNYGANLSLTNDPGEVHWAHYIGKPGYGDIGFYEGGLGFSNGIWRPEPASCMMDNSPYYNAPSRESIVRRIMSAAGLEFDIDRFFNNDTNEILPYSLRMSAPARLDSPIILDRR